MAAPIRSRFPLPVRRAVPISVVARVLTGTVIVTASLATAAVCSADVPSNAQVLQALQQKSPQYFDSSGHCQLHIVNVVEPQPNWFVARVHAETTTETAKIILRQDNPPNGPLVVVAGSGTSFPPGYFAFPDPVRKDIGPA